MNKPLSHTKLSREAKLTLLLLLLASSPRIKFTGNHFTIDGKHVSTESVWKMLRNLETATSNRLKLTTERLYKNQINLEEWRGEVIAILTSAHILAGALAAGSIAPDISAPYINKQISYLNDFEADIRRQKVSEAKGLWRIGLYATAVFVTFAGVSRDEAIKRGATQAKRVRRVSESCNGCVAWSGHWFPIALMPPIGTLDCRGRCRCTILYK